MKGSAKILLGEPAEAFAYVDRAFELSPRDPGVPIWYLYKGVGWLHLRDYDSLGPIALAIVSPKKLPS